MSCNEAIIKKGIGVDERYYVALEGVTLAVSRSTLFKMGLAFFHIAMGNWRVDGAGERIEGLELQVYLKSSKSSKSSNHQDSGQNHTQGKEVIPTMDRRSVIASLKVLRLELEEDCHIDLAADMPEAALMLSDVCAYLGLSKAETAEVMGEKTTKAVEEWAGARLWQPTDAEAAAYAVEELAAVPMPA